MGAAANVLDQNQREQIARELLTNPLPNLCNNRVSSNCPFHSERTPGGAWFYDPADDIGHCHSCGSSADLIGIYCTVHGMDVDDPQGFRDFFERYAPGKLEERGQRQPVLRAPRQAWQPTQRDPSPELWRQKAGQFVTKRAAALLDAPEALAQLERWGITAETASKCSIGWRDEDRFYKFTVWGLPYEENDKGRERCIHAPRGLVFPCYQRGELHRIKIRVDNPGESGLKYKALVGGDTCYGIWGKPEHCRMWIVVETERDAILCWQELRRYGIGAMATGSATIAPDPFAHKLLLRADCIINAMDNDLAGGKSSWGFGQATGFRWDNYPHAIRWLVPSCIGKDVGDLPAAGVSVWDWLRSGLPHHVRTACERAAARILSREQADAAKPRLVTWPDPAMLAERLSQIGVDAYAEVLSSADKYQLALQRAGSVLSVTYAAEAAPHADAHTYVQSILDDTANGLRQVLLEVAA